MVDKSDILFSEYIIDGTVMDSTPADMLTECMPGPCLEKFMSGWQRPGKDATPEPVIDETADRAPVNFRYDCGKENEYLARMMLSIKSKPLSEISADHPRSGTRLAIATSILECLWKDGHFRLGNLDMEASWQWSMAAVGDMAAFYTSIEAATGYIYDLGVKLTDVEIGRRETGHRAEFRICGVEDWLPFRDLDAGASGETFTDEDAYGATGPAEKVWLWNSRKCPDRAILEDRDGAVCSSLIYIPFDTCPHRLGGSLLADVLGNGNENGPEIMDPDYFIDCFEVVRELVEDGVVMSGATVGRGGLMTAVAGLVGYGMPSDGQEESGQYGAGCPATGEIELDISGIEQAYMEDDSIRILFSEIPGAIIQISDDDYDYVDSQLLLQDIAYYPLGRPARTYGKAHIRLSSSSRTGLSAILAALMDGQSSEGED